MPLVDRLVKFEQARGRLLHDPVTIDAAVTFPSRKTEPPQE